MPARVVMFASCHGCGLTSQCYNQSIAFHELLGSGFLAVSGESEQYVGLHQAMHDQHIPLRVLQGLDRHGNMRQLVRHIREIIQQFRPEFVIAQTNWQFVLADLARLRSSVFRLVYVHNGYRHNHLVRALMARATITGMLALRADWAIAPSRFLLNRFGLLRQKTSVIPLGEDPSFFEGASTPRQGSDKMRMVFPGAFRAGKNQFRLITAMRQLEAMKGIPDWELVLPGEGPLLPKCREEAHKIGLGNRIIFPGQLNRAEMLGLYRESQIALVPTNVETFGHCIVEPFVLGRAVISRPVGIAPDIIRHGENGFLFDSFDELAPLLARVLADRELISRVGQSAYAERDQFRWPNVCRRILDVFG